MNRIYLICMMVVSAGLISCEAKEESVTNESEMTCDEECTTINGLDARMV